MKTFIIILIGLVATYLTFVGINNSWLYMSGLSPSECAITIVVYLYIFCLYSFLAWMIITGLTE